jgi:hypothetical protein
LNDSPRYWNSWKGKVLKAIIIDGVDTWASLFTKTDLLDYEVNTALSELYDLDIIKKEDDTYKVIDNEYLEYYNYKVKKLKPRSNKEEIQVFRDWINGISDYIKSRNAENTVIYSFIEWTLGNKIDFNLQSEHIFLNDDMLDRASKDIIRMSNESVYVTNPFVDSCNTSDLIKEKADSCDVRLLTRKPTRESIENCHSVLNNSGVALMTNERVHSKVILVDNLIAVVSSMNLYSGSTGGRSKDASIVTWEKKNIESMIAFFNARWNDAENKKY